MEYTVTSIDELYEICKEEDDYDRSFASPLRRLTWRLEELLSRRDVLIADGDKTKEGFRYSKDELRYIVPEQIKTYDHIEAAVGLAKEELYERFGILWIEDETFENNLDADAISENCSDDIIGGFIQLSFNEFDLLKGVTVA